ncbi:MAG TPA: peptidylprolyl isomerase [Gemmatimonadaceae bacterium]|nr:peptidylprolyl isomerase [Gemmatimonadaceae bacterium]
MTDARRIDEALIREALATGSPVLRAFAARAIGQVRAHELSPTLGGLLADADTAVAANAAFALGLLRDSTAVAALDAALDGAPLVAEQAAWALGAMGDTEAGAVIVRRLAGQRMGGPVLHALLLASARLRPPPATVLASYLASPNPEIAWRAAYALGRNRDPSGVRPLLGAVLHRDQLVRAQIARGLARPAAGDSLATEALRALDLLLVSPHPHVRVNVIQSYATFGPEARTRVLAGVRDGDANVRVAAARALPEVMDRDLTRWAWLWDADTAHAYRRAVLESGVRVGVLLPALGEWSGSPDWRERSAVAGAVAVAEPPLALQWARTLVGDRDARVRAAALGTIARHVDSVPGVVELLRSALADSNPVVRATVLDGLARRATAEDLPAVLQAYAAARHDPESDARVAAVRFIAAAWRRDSTAFGDTARLALAALPPPTDPRERAAGRGVPTLAAWPVNEAEARSLDWYATVVRTLVAPSLNGTLPVVELHTERGVIAVELFATEAPLTVHNFVVLARSGFYRGTNFHRVVPNFVTQDGDPRGDGRGGPGYAIRDELNRHRYERGVMGMALSGPDTGGSQYFLTHSVQPHLDGGYTAFGRVREGMDVLDALLQGDRILDVVVR